MCNKMAFALIYAPYAKERQYSPKNSLASNNISNYLHLLRNHRTITIWHCPMLHKRSNANTRQRTRWRRIIFQTTWHLLRRRRTITIWHCPMLHKRSNAKTRQRTHWCQIIFQTSWHLLRNSRRISICTPLHRICQETSILAKKLVGIE